MVELKFCNSLFPNPLRYEGAVVGKIISILTLVFHQLDFLKNVVNLKGFSN